MLRLHQFCFAFMLTLVGLFAKDGCSQGANFQRVDIALLRSINLQRNIALDPTFKLITNSASPMAIGMPVGMLFIGHWRKDSVLKYQGYELVGSVALSTAIAFGLKYAVNRTRPFATYPDLQKLTDGGGPSFPSGHTSIAFSTATALSLECPRWYVIVPSFAWAALVGYSRMDLGVHYPSDVLGGIIVGCGSAYVSRRAHKWLLRTGSGKTYL